MKDLSKNELVKINGGIFSFAIIADNLTQGFFRLIGGAVAAVEAANNMDLSECDCNYWPDEIGKVE